MISLNTFSFKTWSFMFYFLILTWNLVGNERTLTWDSFFELWIHSEEYSAEKFPLKDQRAKIVEELSPVPKIRFHTPLGFRTSGIHRSQDFSDSNQLPDSSGNQNLSRPPSNSYLWGVSGGMSLMVDFLEFSGSIGSSLEATLFHVPESGYQELSLIPQVFGNLLFPMSTQISKLTRNQKRLELALIDLQEKEQELNFIIRGIDIFSQIGVLWNQLGWIEKILTSLEKLSILQQLAIDSGNLSFKESIELKKELISVNQQRSILEDGLKEIQSYLSIRIFPQISIYEFPNIPPFQDFNSIYTFNNDRKRPDSNIQNQIELQKTWLENHQHYLKALSSPKISISIQGRYQLDQYSWNIAIGLQPSIEFGKQAQREKQKARELNYLMLSQTQREKELSLSKARIAQALESRIRLISDLQAWMAELEQLETQFTLATSYQQMNELEYTKWKLEFYQYQASLEKAKWDVWKLKMIANLMGLKD